MTDECFNSQDRKLFDKKIESWARELFGLPRGAIINNPQEYICIGDCCITKKQIKHVIESRKREDKNIEEVIGILKNIPSVILDAEVEMSDNQKEYPGSIQRGLFLPESNKGIIVVLDCLKKEEVLKLKKEKRGLITAFTKRSSKYRAFLRKQKT